MQGGPETETLLGKSKVSVRYNDSSIDIVSPYYLGQVLRLSTRSDLKKSYKGVVADKLVYSHPSKSVKH